MPPSAATTRIVLGIDIGGTSVKLALLDSATRKPLWTARSAEYARPTSRQLIRAIRDSAASQDFSSIDLVGICVPGLLDREKRRVTLSVNVPGLNDLPLDELVVEAAGVRLRSLEIVNDAIAAAVDVLHGRTTVGRCAVIALGTGVGIAVIEPDGTPLRLDGDSPGHVGMLDVSFESDPSLTPIGPDGGAGSLEGYIGVPAIIKRYGSVRSFLEGAPSPDQPPLIALSRALRICHAIYRPQHVILVGGIGVRMNRHLPVLRELVSRRLTSIARKGWTLEIGDHDFHAASGAARLALAAHPPEIA